MNPFCSWKYAPRAVVAFAVFACLASHAAVRRDDPASIRGAIYVPANVYNAPQLWRNFNPAEVKRDCGYARELHINAFRMWASYEFWRANPDRFQSAFDQMLSIAHENGIRVLISLFENDGVPPTEANMWSTDPTKAFDIQSPGNAIAFGDKAGWEEPRKFVAWFMKRYGSDDRVLAIEVMNEPSVAKPGGGGTVPFAQSMLSTAKAMQGTVPLTIGSARIENAALFLPIGLDIVEFHDNFPENTTELESRIKEAMAFGQKHNLPVWFTEWQRLRPSGQGFGTKKIAVTERGPDYASMANTIRQYPIGNFFWALMVNRAYLKPQRLNGTVNGVFWPDGSVISLKDARAIANDPKLQLQEKPVPPGFGVEAVSSTPEASSVAR